MPKDMKGAREAGELLADAVTAGDRVCIVADYDCDGASACAIIMRGMRMLGAKEGSVSYVVPDRQKDGYGLTPEIVDRAVERHDPRIIVTVDNGIASFAGVERANELGIKAVVTDHHLPAIVDGEVKLPAATVIVNPTQPGCAFPSKSICGAGVAFYIMLTARACLRERGKFDVASQPKMDSLLDLVATATVADVVKLDENNRRLVANGLERMRAGKCQPGIKALFRVAGRNIGAASSMDLGFTLGPRINAAGRMADMTIGIECLTTDDEGRAGELAQSLHKINQERRATEAEMAELASKAVSELQALGDDAAIVIYDETFHEGVVGIVAGRIKEREHRPTFVFAKAQDGNLKGSGRSIAGFHMRDALDLLVKRVPGVVLKFGGHAMAAGCTIVPEGIEAFRTALAQIARELLTKAMMERVVEIDGSLDRVDYSVNTARQLDQIVWGQGFEQPVFVDQVKVIEQRLVGSKHLKLLVDVTGQRRDGIWFGRTEPLPEDAQLAYRIGVNEWNGRESVQMVVDGLLPGRGLRP